MTARPDWLPSYLFPFENSRIDVDQIHILDVGSQAGDPPTLLLVHGIQIGCSLARCDSSACGPESWI